jgi:hypothetical protein
MVVSLKRDKVIFFKVMPQSGPKDTVPIGSIKGKIAMKRTAILAVTLFLAQVTGAVATTTCTQVGSQVICTDNRSGTNTTCRQVGSQVICW